MKVIEIIKRIKKFKNKDYAKSISHLVLWNGLMMQCTIGKEGNGIVDFVDNTRNDRLIIRIDYHRERLNYKFIYLKLVEALK